MKRIVSYIKQSLEDFSDLLFPNRCIACANPIQGNDDLVCVGCRMNLSYAHINHDHNNALTQDLKVLMDIECAFSLFHFIPNGCIQHILHHVKYQGRKDAAVLFGEELASNILAHNPNLIAFDAIIPVPLHPLKAQKRGYNQSDYLGEGMAKVFAAPLLSTVLKRVENKGSQTKLKRYQRFLNAETVYQSDRLDEKFKNILLIDDVITSGSTMQACVSALKSNNTIKISVASLAFVHK